MRHVGGMIGLVAGKDGWALVDEMVALRTSEDEPWVEEEGIAGVESAAAVAGDAFVANEKAMEDEHGGMATVHAGRTWPSASQLVSPGVAKDSGEGGDEKSRDGDVEDGEDEDNGCGSAASWPSSGLRQRPCFHPWGGLVAWELHHDMSWPCSGA